MKFMSLKIEDYLNYRHKMGYVIKIEGYLLRKFGEYFDSYSSNNRLTTEIAIKWARLPTNASPFYWARRLEIVRCFARYLSLSETKTEIPPLGILGPAHRRIQPHIYSSDEIKTLLEKCQTLNPKNSLRPHTYHTFFALLACTGMRFSEAINLQRDKVDFQNGLLKIIETKFKKSRLLPLHTSTIQALRAYDSLRNNFCPIPDDNSFFISRFGKKLCKSTVRSTFSALRHRLNWEKHGTRYPRIYDLRHSFACHLLLQWQKKKCLHEKLPILSTYLGHVKLEATYWYLSGVPELFDAVGNIFENFTKGKENE